MTQPSPRQSSPIMVDDLLSRLRAGIPDSFYIEIGEALNLEGDEPTPEWYIDIRHSSDPRALRPEPDPWPFIAPAFSVALTAAVQHVEAVNA